MEISSSTFGFNIDRGGTFTDFYVQEIVQSSVINQYAFKVLSQSPQGEGPIIGIKKFLGERGLLGNSDKISNSSIEYINLGTTIATNALLQRKGCKNAMILTEGFHDLLSIRHQARPNIFDLKNTKNPPLASKTYQISQRTFIKDSNNPELQQKKLNNKQIYIKEPLQQQIKQISIQLKENGIQSIGISLCNGYIYDGNQRKIMQIFVRQGFQHIQIGSKYHSQGYLIRSQTTNLDAFLNPIMKKYFTSFSQHFQQPGKLVLRIMKSDGGFSAYSDVRASQLLLSGPAGGLIGYQSLLDTFAKISKSSINNLIGLDMGGTSTDVSRVEDRQFSIRYNFQVQGIQLCSPHLQIDTIAAGGGSKLTFSNGMLVVGPESVGSNPGPVCYGIGDELALTDANLILGRLDQTYFPKIFGKNRDQGLNIEASRKAFKKLVEVINKNDENMSSQIIAEGYIEIANELMAKSARKLLTMGLPDALVIFGSAGGQHCCDLAIKIGVSKVFIHKYSGILSAYGLSMAKETIQNKTILDLKINKNNYSYKQLIKIIEPHKTKNPQQYEKVIYEIGIGYQGTSYTIKVPLNQDFIDNFEIMHKKQNGFLLNTCFLRIQYLVQKFIKEPKRFKKEEVFYEKQDCGKYLLKHKQVFIDGKFIQIPVFNIQNIKYCQIKGPALLLSSTSSILLKQHWTAQLTHQLAYLQYNKPKNIQFSHATVHKPDPIKLTLYSTRLMSIAEQMGKVLQKVSISTNIRERLDFSCGIFDWNGKLLANAPHLPVHLGSMETAVSQQIARGIQIGDVILTNHPNAGGSHLPDLTVVTCSQINGTRMYLASRGHHADIGGITPGSMPSFSKHISEQGVAVQKFKMTQKGNIRQKELRQLFKQSRRLQDNISDLLAQMSANNMGVKLLQKLIDEYGIQQFKQYVQFICQNAAESVRQLLYSFSIQHQLEEIGTLKNLQFMDDGTPLVLALTIDRINRNAVFDFSGTGKQVLANTNTPRSITRSAILYCLRSLIGKDIPLNSGVLVPLKIIIPDGTILSPSKEAAVVGGNVQTSQKLVDLILKPFCHVACSQGTMNNFVFGTDTITYYETICGGSGAGQGWNGTTIQCHMTNTRITDVESIEKTYPVIVTKFKQRINSGGKGKYNGGNGVIRQFLFLEDVTVSLLTERRVFSAYGLKGAQNGKVGQNTYINQKGIQKNVGGKNTFKVKSGEFVRIQTPGGGGYGI